MSFEKHVKTVLAPYVSEKSVRLSDKHRQFTFKVAKLATKPKVKEAVEALFNVKVEAVRISNVKPVLKRIRNRMGTQSGWKKAIVKLAEGHDIDFTKPV